MEDAMDRLPFPGGQTSGSGVGHFRVSIHVGRRGEGGEHCVLLEALVDTGSTYTWVPRDVLQRLGVTAEEQWPFELANGREVRYPVAWAQIRIGGAGAADDRRVRRAGLRTDPRRGHPGRVPASCRSRASAADPSAGTPEARVGRRGSFARARVILSAAGAKDLLFQPRMSSTRSAMPGTSAGVRVS